MKIAIIGSGGREHAIAWKLCQNHPIEDVYLLPGNPGYLNSHSLAINNFAEIKKFCNEKKINLLIVGPEVPLANGIADYFFGSDVQVFGPKKEATLLESSKIWAKNFMNRHKVATAPFWSFDCAENAVSLIESLKGQLVIKYDGLAAGKGVAVCSEKEKALQFLESIQKTHGSKASFLIEEKLSGQEISVIGFTNGKEIKLMSSSQDHKRAYDGDLGPNTGGMGAYCPASFCDEVLLASIYKKIIHPTLEGLQRDKIDYQGVIYFGIMVTEEGPHLLEYNIRFGDPEAEVILPALRNDLLEPILGCFDDSLSKVKLEFRQEAFVDVVLASRGYPEAYQGGIEIKGLDTLNSKTYVFHAGTRQSGKKIVTNGGRVLNVVCSGASLQEAIDNVYKECQKIHFEGMFYRSDIGAKGLCNSFLTTTICEK